jgi:hypothetical protein
MLRADRRSFVVNLGANTGRGVAPFELAKVMGTSLAMLERHYGTLIGGAHEGIARLEALDAELEKAAEAEVKP